MSKLLQFANFQELINWSVKNNLPFSFFKSGYNFVKLEKLIKPRQEKIKKDDYNLEIDIVKKISFKDGIIELREERKTGMDMYVTYPNDLLVSNINFHQGALAINNYEKNILCSTHYQPYIINTKLVLGSYLVMILRSDLYKKYIIYSKSDGIKTESKFNFIKDLKIPLPSVEQQKEIVNKYYEKVNLSKEQEIEASQKEDDIEKYLFSELSFEVKNDDNENKLLQFVKFKNINRWDTQSNYFNPDNLKSNYKFVRISELIKYSQYGLSEKADLNSTNIPFLRMNNIQNGELNISDLKYIHLSEKQKENYLLDYGDILFNRTNSKELVGKCAVFKLEQIYSFASYLIRLKLNHELVNHDYFVILLNSSLGRMQIDATSRQITGQVNINVEELKSFLLPLPPIEIQEKIVNNIEIIKKDIKDLREKAISNKQFALNDFESEIFNETE